MPSRISDEHAVETNLGAKVRRKSKPAIGISDLPFSNLRRSSGTITSSTSGSFGSLLTSTPCSLNFSRAACNLDKTRLLVPSACCLWLFNIATSSRIKITASEVMRSVSELARPDPSCSAAICTSPCLLKGFGQILQVLIQFVDRSTQFFGGLTKVFVRDLHNLLIS